MATRKNKPELAGFKAVVQVALLPDMIESVITLIAEPLDILDRMGRLPEYGLAVGLQTNPQGGYTCSIRCVDPSNGNAGLMFFSNGPTVIEAIGVAIVKLDFLERLGDWTVGNTLGSGTGYR